MLAAISAATLTGAVGRPVSVEVHVSSGLPGFTMVGLPDAAVRESRDRVRAALLSSGLPWPLRRVTVNLAPSRFAFGKLTGEQCAASTISLLTLCPGHPATPPH
jgi:predicted ATPase with chaperone activity